MVCDYWVRNITSSELMFALTDFYKDFLYKDLKLIEKSYL